jgi:hypothetical protein
VGQEKIESLFSPGPLFCLASFDVRSTGKFITAIITAIKKRAYGRNRKPLIFLEAAPGFEPGDEGFAVLCLTTWPRRPLLSKETILYLESFSMSTVIFAISQ